MPKRVIREIIFNNEIGPSDFEMEIKAPEIAREAKPGQFVHLKWADEFGKNDPLLRRPISFNEVDPVKGKIKLIYRVVGRGTELLSSLKAGDKIDLMGPLGNGFSIEKGMDKIAVIGGGMGIAPLLSLVEDLIAAQKRVTVFLGAREKNELLNLSYYQTLGVETKVATEDGSYGEEGFITELLPQSREFDYVYTCGPTPMLKEIQKWVREQGIKGQVSLEERMGCGTGACLSCVCKIKVAAEEDWDYQKICTDGPVFPIKKVVFNE